MEIKIKNKKKKKYFSILIKKSPFSLPQEDLKKYQEFWSDICWSDKI